jgi:hypothetical protein
MDEQNAEACSDLDEDHIAGTCRLEEISGSIQDPHIKCIVTCGEKVVAYPTGTYIQGHSPARDETAFQALIWKQCHAENGAVGSGSFHTCVP